MNVTEDWRNDNNAIKLRMGDYVLKNNNMIYLGTAKKLDEFRVTSDVTIPSLAGLVFIYRYFDGKHMTIFYRNNNGDLFYIKTTNISDCNKKCNKAVHEICGTDGVTYNNSCFLSQASCVSNGLISQAHEGKCKIPPNQKMTISYELGCKEFVYSFDKDVASVYMLFT